MKVAIVSFDGFNEIDSIIAHSMLNQVGEPDWTVSIVAPSETVTSKHGTTMLTQRPLAFANEADVVLFGSGVDSFSVAQNAKLMSTFRLCSKRQLIGSQCSGAVFSHTLGISTNLPVCTDDETKPRLRAMGARVINKAFTVSGNVASAGGCFASIYLATWVIARVAGVNEAKRVVRYFAPVCQKDVYTAQTLEAVFEGFDNR
ncbi:MAG: DJ-1/PfpI family protein [Pseudomonadota bacterium]